MTSLFAQVRYEAFKSAHQRELSRICCAEIEVDGLGSYPHIFPDVRTAMCANRQRTDVNRAQPGLFDVSHQGILITARRAFIGWSKGSNEPKQRPPPSLESIMSTLRKNV